MSDEVVIVVGRNRGEPDNYYAFFPNGPSITHVGDTAEEATSNLLQDNAPAIERIMRVFNQGVKVNAEDN